MVIRSYREMILARAQHKETSIGRTRFHHNPAAWWHLLSLDAPTIAALWSWFFSSAMHLAMPITQALMLGLGTWLLYVADRILDGLGGNPEGHLRERHHFHARHRTAFLVAAAFLTVLLAWSAFTRLRPEALHEDSIILLCVLAYLAAVHRRKVRWLPKELAVAIVFSAATAVPAWSLISTHTNNIRSGREQLVPAVLFFTLLCWMNCVGIEKWESPLPPHPRSNSHPTTQWAGLHLRAIVTVIALFAIGAALKAPSHGLMAVYLAALLSSALLFLLDARSPRLSPLHLRIAADAALLTPLALFPLAR